MILRIPDAMADRLKVGGGDIGRRALEALALKEYRGGRLSKKELRQALGFETRAELDGFFKARGVNEGITLAEVERDLRDFCRPAP